MPAFDYDSHVFSNEVSISADTKNLMGLKLGRFLEQLEKTPRKERMLEMGCGIGNISRIITQRNPKTELVGIDISHNALRVAKKSTSRIELCKSDATKLPFRSNEFDVVFGFDIVEHVEKPGDLISEAYRVLKPGGIAHFHIPCEGEPLSLWWFLWKLNFFGDLKQIHAGHLHRFTQKGILNMFAERNFKIVTVRYSFHFIGQLLDFMQWMATAFRYQSENENDLEFSFTQPVFMENKNKMVTRLYRAYKICTAVMSHGAYIESRIFRGFKAAMAVDITAAKTDWNS